MTSRNILGAGVLATLLAGAGAAHATSYTVQTVQFPADPGFTQLLGINNTGTIAGYHGATVNQGFTLVLPGTFTSQNFPGSVQTQVIGINGVGSTAGFFVDQAGTTHGFTRIGGAFTAVDQGGTAFNQLLGINVANVAVGYSSTDAGGGILQKAYSVAGGTFTDINALLPTTNQNSQATGINTAGIVVGFYLPTATTSVGFQDVSGTISTIDPFGSASTQALGINNTGEVVGSYVDANGVQHGYTRIGGAFASFDPAGSTNTVVNGVNDLGQLVGFFVDGQNNTIGFVATPVPEPMSLALLGTGALAVLARRSRRGIGTVWARLAG